MPINTKCTLLPRSWGHKLRNPHLCLSLPENYKVETTIQQYDVVIEKCKDIFLKKTKDYGTAWRILRLSSLTDQLFIKAKRIRSLEEKAEQRVDDPVEGEYIGLVNYSVIALMQMHLTDKDPLELDPALVEEYYTKLVQQTKALMIAKNHDYGEVWRAMRISSLTDLILMKLLRVKQIEDNQGKTIISEGLDANYMDIINYAVFAMIRLDEITNNA